MSKRTTIRIPDDVYDQLSHQAQQEQRTISNLAIILLREGLRDRWRKFPIDSRIDSHPESSDQHKAPDVSAEGFAEG